MRAPDNSSARAHSYGYAVYILTERHHPLRGSGCARPSAAPSGGGGGNPSPLSCSNHSAIATSFQLVYLRIFATQT